MKKRIRLAYIFGPIIFAAKLIFTLNYIYLFCDQPFGKYENDWGNKIEFLSGSLVVFMIMLWFFIFFMKFNSAPEK